MLKRLFFFFMAISLPLSACGILDRLDDKVVMTVGSRKVTVEAFKRDVRFVTSGIGILDQEVEVLIRPIIDKMIDHYLIMEYGLRAGITLSEGELQATVEGIRSEYPEDVFQETLLRSYVDFDEWKEGLRQQLLVRKIVLTVSEGIPPVTYQEIRGYYESHQEEFMRPEMVEFRQVVTRTGDEARRILDRVSHGESLDDLARKYSITPEAENGGEVGLVAKGELEESMEKVVFALPVGKTSSVVKTPYGYHIFEVMAKRSAGQGSLPEVMEDIETKLLQRKKEASYKSWLEGLREEFPVKVNEKLLKTLEFG
jgi:parvulin-like peptidyl-prolyl isomerase